MNTLLVDVCDTLFRSNTTFDFMAWHDRDDPTTTQLLRSRHHIWHRLHYRLTGEDRIRTRVIARLADADAAILQEQGRQFVQTIEKINETWKLIRTYQNDGYRVVLLSSSLDCVVRAVAEQLDADWHASELGFRDGRCTGVLVRDLLHDKHSVITDHYATDNTVMLTDNRTDLACAGLVGQFIAVRARSDERARKFWQRHGIRQQLVYDR
ncbi:MAG: HAD-IB family phosphatase [Pseudomonadota bacterium]